MKHLLLITLTLLLSACHQDQLIGTWLQPIPGQTDSFQGFTLQADGRATSVNMYTLQYENWQKRDDVLILKGKSIGNGRTIDITEEFTIKQLDDKHLSLQLGNFVTNYTRQPKS